MNAWFSDQRPLMSSIFDYLETKDVCKWRCTTKYTGMTDAFAHPVTWKQHVCISAPVFECGQCQRLRGPNGAFYCQNCSKTSCVQHVYSCNVCSHTICHQCATNVGCLSCYG